MKKLSLIAVLTLSTMLSACGGGGGGSGHIPTTTLPDINTVTNNETSMTTQKFSNGEKRIELYQNAENQATTFPGRRMARTLATIDKTAVNEAYSKMSDLLINGNNAANTQELRRSLLLAGFSKDELPASDLENWVKIHANKIKNKAQTVWNMYGVEKEISIDNAKFNVVNIDAKQDSYISFSVDNKGKIQKLHFDVDKDSADSRNMSLSRTGDGKFERTGQMLIYGVKLENGQEVRLEFFEKPENIAQLQNMLIAELYDNKEQGNFDGSGDADKLVSDAETWIKTLTLADFDSYNEENAPNKNAYSEGQEAKTTVTYTSYAKDLNDKKGLQYADFGTVKIGSMEGNVPVNETFVFAGGMDAKRISADDLQGKMEFAGTAVAALIHQDETSGERVETTDSYNGTANLVFDGGQETLTTKFDGWYNVVVNSNDAKDNYNIKFEGTPDNEMYKFNNTSVNDFVGNRGNGGSDYGAVDFGYYGDTKDNPTEAAGYVAYGEHIKNNVNLHAQIGFGAVKK